MTRGKTAVIMSFPYLHQWRWQLQDCSWNLQQKEEEVLYDTSGNISSVQLAWSKWTCGPTTIAQRVRQIKADPTLVLGRRNSSLHKKNRHLPELIEPMMQSGADEGVAVSLAVQIADSMSLTLDQMREGARLLASQTAKQDTHPLTVETAVPLREYKQAVSWACQQIKSTAVCSDKLSMATVAEAHLREAMAATSHMS